MKYIAAVWIHVGFVYQLLRKTGLFFVLLLLASVARAQEEKPLPMPQVTSKTTGKCVVVTHGWRKLSTVKPVGPRNALCTALSPMRRPAGKLGIFPWNRFEPVKYAGQDRSGTSTRCKRRWQHAANGWTRYIRNDNALRPGGSGDESDATRANDGVFADRKTRADFEAFDKLMKRRGGSPKRAGARLSNYTRGFPA